MGFSGVRLAFLILAMVLAGGVLTLGWAMAAWHRSTGDTVARMRAGAVAGTGTFSARTLDGLPPPVARYFRGTLTDGQPLVASAVATQEAEFFANGAWRPLRATQHFVAAPPGFVWDARIEMAPFMAAHVRDAYVGGHGFMQATMFGLFTLVDEKDKPALDAGALHRFLGEAVWFPTALLPGARLAWRAVDDRTATATLTDGPASVSLDFRFDDRGDIVEVFGDRYAERDGAYELRPWHVRCAEHATQDGMRIPRYCEVSWVEAGAPQPYWRGRLASVHYTFNRLE